MFYWVHLLHGNQKPLHSIARRRFKPVPVDIRREPHVCRSDKTPYAEAMGQRHAFLGFSTRLHVVDEFPLPKAAYMKGMRTSAIFIPSS